MQSGNNALGPYPASIIYKSAAGRYGPMTARYRFMYSAYWGSD